MKRLLLVRHGHAVSNLNDVVNSRPPGEGLSDEGRSQARALAQTLAATRIDLGIASRLRRTQETIALALAGRDVPTLVEPLFDEIDFGAYEGGPLEHYRTWAWTTPPEDPPDGFGESRVALARRVAAALETFLERDEAVILAVGHALPLRYIVDAATGVEPRARMTPVPNATPTALDAEAVVRARDALLSWAARPSFADQLPARSQEGST